MNEIDEAASIIQKTVDSDADIIFGSAIDEQLVDQIKITVVATRFDESRSRFAFGSQPTRFQKQLDEELKEEEPEEEISLYPPEKKEERRVESARASNQSQPKDVNLDDDDEFDIPAFLRRK